MFQGGNSYQSCSQNQQRSGLLAGPIGVRLSQLERQYKKRRTTSMPISHYLHMAVLVRDFG